MVLVLMTFQEVRVVVDEEDGSVVVIGIAVVAQAFKCREVIDRAYD